MFVRDGATREIVRSVGLEGNTSEDEEGRIHLAVRKAVMAAMLGREIGFNSFPALRTRGSERSTASKYASANGT